MKKEYVDYLFVCTANRLRSPTAEHVARTMGYAADSVGALAEYAVRPLTTEAILRAKRIICMEPMHEQIVREHIKRELGEQALLRLIFRIDVWDLPDVYDYGDPRLITIIRAAIGRTKAEVEKLEEVALRRGSAPEAVRILSERVHDINCQCPVCTAEERT